MRSRTLLPVFKGRRMRSRTSFGIAGRPGLPKRDSFVQYSRSFFLRPAMTASGRTITRVSRQLGQARESQGQQEGPIGQAKPRSLRSATQYGESIWGPAAGIGSRYMATSGGPNSDTLYRRNLFQYKDLTWDPGVPS